MVNGVNVSVELMHLSIVLQASQDLLQQHYIDLKDRPFFPTLITYMSSGPLVAMVRDNTHMHTVCGGCTTKPEASLDLLSANTAAHFISKLVYYRCGKVKVW